MAAAQSIRNKLLIRDSWIHEASQRSELFFADFIGQFASTLCQVIKSGLDFSLDRSLTGKEIKVKGDGKNRSRKPQPIDFDCLSFELRRTRTVTWIIRILIKILSFNFRRWNFIIMGHSLAFHYTTTVDV